jgi:hypothetical protein
MISGPFFYWQLGWRWLRNDGSWTAFGHTGGHYVYLVPFVEDEQTVFLKTIIPSRKATKQYLGEESDDEA